MSLLNNSYIFLTAFISIICMAFIDYIFYNIAVLYNKVTLYRIFQTILTIALTILLYSLNPTIALIFIILFFTWWSDIFYYVLYDTLKLFGRQYAGKAFYNEVMDNRVTWAWWTIYGLIHSIIYGKDKPISGFILILQAIIGMIVALLIAYTIK